jgi:hypothetical protein
MLEEKRTKSGVGILSRLKKNPDLKNILDFYIVAALSHVMDRQREQEIERECNKSGTFRGTVLT